MTLQGTIHEDTCTFVENKIALLATAAARELDMFCPENLPSEIQLLFEYVLR